MSDSTQWFREARFGMFVHYGLYSLLGRGEWVMAKEAIPRETYRLLANRFTAEAFDAEALCDLAVQAGMKYINFTTMHHDGFRLYHSELTDFCTTKTACERDLVEEVVEAARRRGLRISLYHSLNNWMDMPDAVDALEDPQAYETFIASTFARIEELLQRFNPIDVLWYDGWWPFNAEGWQAERMNDMARSIQPHLLFNGRNGLPGDFGTPEGHLSAPNPWRPWEACITHNDSWGYTLGDDQWKSPKQIVQMLATCAQGQGNLLLNVGPTGEGEIPAATQDAFRQIGRWLQVHSEAFFDTDRFTFDLREQGDHRGDWGHLGPITAKGNCLYLIGLKWPCDDFALCGFDGRLQQATFLKNGESIEFEQNDRRIQFKGLIGRGNDAIGPVVKLTFDQPVSMYTVPAMRVPSVEHPHYDPCPSDIQH